MDEIFSHAECKWIPTMNSYIGPSLWNDQDKSLKTSASLNGFKHNIKDYYFRKGNKKES